jgi:hypothetical protein
VIPSSMPQFRSLHSEVQAVFTHPKGDMALLCDAVAATAAAAEVRAQYHITTAVITSYNFQ